jgi:hypothetical protein
MKGNACLDFQSSALPTELSCHRVGNIRRMGIISENPKPAAIHCCRHILRRLQSQRQVCSCFPEANIFTTARPRGQANLKSGESTEAETGIGQGAPGSNHPPDPITNSCHGRVIIGYWRGGSRTPMTPVTRNRAREKISWINRGAPSQLRPVFGFAHFLTFMLLFFFRFVDNQSPNGKDKD